MYAQLADQVLDEFEVFTFRPTFEHVHGVIANYYVYIFDESGELIEGEPMRGGKCQIALTDHELRNARIALGPSFEDFQGAPVMLDELKAFNVHEVEWRYQPGRRDYVLSPIPESTWRQWLAHSLWRRLPRTISESYFLAM